jgi:hypothetical protein
VLLLLQLPDLLSPGGQAFIVTVTENRPQGEQQYVPHKPHLLFMWPAEYGTHMAYGIASAWAGGLAGRHVTDRLLGQLPDLLSSNGHAFVVIVTENRPQGDCQRLCTVCLCFLTCRLDVPGSLMHVCKQPRSINLTYLLEALCLDCCMQSWLQASALS